MILSHALHSATRHFEADSATAKGRLEFSGHEFFFEGHFPGEPIVPAFVQIDIALHLAARAMGRELELIEVLRAVFKRPVGPGSSLEFSLKMQPSEGGLTRIRCDVTSETLPVAELSLRVSAR